MKIKFLKSLIFFSLIAGSGFAEEQESLLSDQNGDGVVQLVSFGDSITFGVGDTNLTGGYVSRVGTLLGVGANNEGVPGEEIVATGVYRFPSVIASSNADIITIMEGTNDAVKRAESSQVRNAYQKVINVARASGKTVVLATLPPPCCDRAAEAPFTNSYSNAAEDLAAINGIRIVDFNKAWLTTCTNPAECELYNLPEGLHPNGTGYDVMAQTLAASILGIDIFSEGGASDLESALGLPKGSVIVKPEVSQ